MELSKIVPRHGSSINKRTKIVCRYVPDELLNQDSAIEHFSQFGPCRVKLITKRKSCIVEYNNVKDTEDALQNAGEYMNSAFKVTLYNSPLKRKLVKKPSDSAWLPASEVEDELRAMAETGVEYKNVHVLRNNEKPTKRPPKKILPKSWEGETAPKIESVSKSNTWMPEQLDLLKILKQPAAGVEEKYKLLEARDKLIRLRTKKDVDIRNTPTVGTCPDMCPEKERLMRVVQHQVSFYEQDLNGKLDPTLSIKQYSRSSADQEMPLPHELRPVSVLQLTMGYLMHCIMDLCDTDDVNIGDWYHFLWDRTRSIRKDITQQELCSQGSVELIEQCARFHIHCSARLVAEDPSVFDHKINSENLTKCLQTLKYMYNDLNLKGENCPNEAEFRAYIILLNLNNSNFMWEVQQLKPEIQKSPQVKFALQIYSTIDKSNYVKFFKLVNSTGYLNACILFRYFVQVRIQALSIITKCYSLRNPTNFSIFELKQLLGFEDSMSTIDFINRNGLYLNDVETHVVLDRKSLIYPELPYPLDRAINVIESKRQHTVGEVVCGASLPLPLFKNHVPFNSFDEYGCFIMDDAFKELIKYDTKQVIDEPDSKVTTSIEIFSTKTPTQKLTNIEKQSTSLSNKFNPFVSGIKPFSEDFQKPISVFGSGSTTTSSSIFNIPPQESKNNSDQQQQHFLKTSSIFGNKVPSAANDDQEKLASNSSDKKKSIFGNPQATGIFQQQTQIFSEQPKTSFMKIFENTFSTTKSEHKLANIFSDDNTQPPIDPNLITFDVDDSLSSSTTSSFPTTSVLDKPQSLNKNLTEKFELPRLLSEKKNELKLMQKQIEVKQLEEKRKLEDLKKKKLEEEKRLEKQRLLEIEKKNQLLQEQQKKLKKIEEVKRQEKIRLEHLEIQKAVEDLLEDLLHQVVTKSKEERLREICKKNVNYKMRLFVKKWIKNSKTKKRIRECLNFPPVGWPCRTVDETAKELFIDYQKSNLLDIKRYKSGQSVELTLPSVPAVKKINVARFYKILTNTYSKLYERIQKELFWKVTISVPLFEEFKIGLYFIEDFLMNFFQWKERYGATNITGQYVAENRLSYSIDRRHGVTTVENSTHGLLFIADKPNKLLLSRIRESLKQFPKFVSVPVFILFINNYTENLCCDHLSRVLKQTAHISQHKICRTNFDHTEVFTKIEEGLDFLAQSIAAPPPLELNFLGVILNELLAEGFWKRIAAYAEWNSKYEMCLKSPEIVISLYNEAVDRLKDVLLDESCLEYLDFPNEFENLLMDQFPDVMPCNYKYFPSFWKTKSYRNLLSTKINSMKFPKYCKEWPPTSELQLQSDIFDYCKLIFNEPQNPFYKVMAVILKNANLNSDFQSISSVAWCDIIEVLVNENLHALNFQLEPTEFNSRSIYTHYFAIYNVKSLKAYKTDDWFYLGHSLIKNKIAQLQPRQRKRKISVVLPEFNIDLDELERSLRDADDGSNSAQADVKKMKYIMDDLEESMKIQKQILFKFNKNVQNFLNSGEIVNK